MNTQPDPLAARPKRQQHLSKNRLWRSFPQVPNLLQYVPNSNYYGRIKVRGKLFCRSLETDTWTVAKLRLSDFVHKQQAARSAGTAPRFSQAVELFKRDLETKTRLKARSKQYRLLCLKKLQQSWPELWELTLAQISEPACKEWAALLHRQITCHYYNNTVGTLRMVLQAGLKAHLEQGVA